MKAEKIGNLDTDKDTNNLPAATADDVKSIFKDLSETHLPKKCLKGYTQNTNECVNSIVWKLCPKVKRHGLTVVNSATAVAGCIFSGGTSSSETVLGEMQLAVGAFERNFFSAKDSARIITLHASKESRGRRRMRRLGQDGR